MAQLDGVRVAVLTTQGVEEVEITDTTTALREAGARVDILSPDGGEIQAMKHDEKSIKIPSDGRIAEANSNVYDAVLLPGGAFNSDKLRMDMDARRFVQEIQGDGKPIAVICHAPWLLVSAGLVSGRTLTSYYTIQDDIRTAGGNWVDQEVVLDANWVSSRGPADIPAFNHAMIDLFSRVPARRN